MEPRTGGSDAAVIGGVVAVALFVLIVAIVLIVRYFMAHKGKKGYRNEYCLFISDQARSSAVVCWQAL